MTEGNKESSWVTAIRMIKQMNDPCLRSTFEVNSCEPAFPTWWLSCDSKLLLKKAQEMALVEGRHELAIPLRELEKLHFTGEISD